MAGYLGKLLRVNLTSKTIQTEALDLSLAKHYIGGRGLGTKILMDEVSPKVDALSPENKIVVLTGPLSGTPTPTGGRYMVITKSPLTDTVACSNSGGHWGAELKYAGYDGIIIEGKSEEPCYLLIEDHEVTIKPATDLWGGLVGATTKTLNGRYTEKHRVMTIGPAGERLSRIAAIMNDTDRAAGRSGVGAVMGSKLLKAIVVRGTQTVPVHNAEQLKVAFSDALKKIKANGVTGQGLPTYGTAVLVNIINENGVLPTRNFQEAYDPKADEISGESLADRYLVKREACHRCPIACGRYCKVDEVEGGGPEYETIWAFGSDCGVSDLASVIKANYWCNEMGLDTISAGATIAAAMELKEKGLIPEELLEGEGLDFGDADAVVKWTKKMGLREGLGHFMAEGSYRMADHFGAPELSMTVKKQELPAYDPRGIQGHGLQYATSNRGGCHVRGYLISPEILGEPTKLDRFSLEGKAGWAKVFQDLTAVIDSMGLCLFTSFALGAPEYAELLNCVTGSEHTAETLLTAGERIYNIERLYNLESGVSPDQDTLPKRLLEEPIPAGPSKDWVHKLSDLLPEYYALRGWSKEGIPTQARLEELGIK